MSISFLCEVQTAALPAKFHGMLVLAFPCSLHLVRPLRSDVSGAPIAEFSVSLSSVLFLHTRPNCGSLSASSKSMKRHKALV